MTTLFTDPPCTGPEPGLDAEEMIPRLEKYRVAGIPILPAFHWVSPHRPFLREGGKLVPNPGQWGVCCKYCDAWHWHGEADHPR